MASVSERNSEVLAALQAEVDAIDQRQQRVETAVVGLDGKIDRTSGELSRDIKEVGARFDAAIASISSKIDARGITPWATIIATLTLVLAGMTTIGWLARQPLEDGIDRNTAELRLNAELRRAEDRRLADQLSLMRHDLDYLRGHYDASKR